MNRFTLRYEFIDVPLADGELVTGRAPECDLVMDDAAVSRRHASFRVEGASVLVQDLESRNGVLVNGIRLEEPMRLRHGDRIRIGTKDLTLHDTARTRRRRSTGTTELIRCETCGSLKQPQEQCAQCEINRASIDGELPTLTVAPIDETDVSTAPTAPREAHSNFRTLSRLADRALEMGRGAESERLLSGALHKLLARAEGSDDVSGAEASEAATYALRLAQVTGNARWADYPLDLYAALDAVMPQAVVERLYGVAGPLKYANPVPLRRYIGQLREQEGTLGPNERFILSRLDGLARMIASR